MVLVSFFIVLHSICLGKIANNYIENYSFFWNEKIVGRK